MAKKTKKAKIPVRSWWFQLGKLLSRFTVEITAVGESLYEKTISRTDTALQRKDALVEKAIELLRRADEILGSLTDVSS